MQERLKRAQVPVEQTWNLEDLCPTVEAWEAAMADVEASIPSVTQYRGRLGEGPEVMVACLEAQEELYKKFIVAATYASLRNSEDGTDPANQGLAARVGGLGAKVGAALAFFRTETLALPEGTIQKFMAAEPKLEEFRPTLEELMELKPHTLSPETEVALATLGEVLGAPGMIYNRSKASDMQFEPITLEDGSQHPVSFAVYEDKLELSADHHIRRQAWESFVKGLQKYKNTFAATWATEVKKNVALAKIRKYPSATHMLLHQHRVGLDAYTNLLDIIQTELAPHMQRYARLRKRVLGLDKLLYPDIEAPLDPEYNPPITREAASDLILEALSVLGPEYGQIMKRGISERWIDWADNVGKATGAFCSSPYGVHPFILITWTDAMRGCFVLAHELGHAGHFALAQRNQRLTNTRPSTYFVEAPSTINELILGNHILSKSSDVRMRRWVAMQFLATYHHNFVRHLLEGELQRRIYALGEKGAPITAQTLCQTKGDILRQFWGDTVEVDEGATLTWMRQPHYYMGLYPYTYSAGLTAATAVAQMIREDGQPAVDRWLKVLKSGGTMKPVDLMKLAGVDMTSPEPIRKAVAYVGSLVDEVEKSF